MKDDGCGTGDKLSPDGGFRPGGGRSPGGGTSCGVGGGVWTGPPPAYGLVRKDVSDVMESTGSRSVACLATPGSGLTRSSGVGMFLAVTGGWLWKRQKMW